MSLVDYASSDEDEEEIRAEVKESMQVQNEKLDVPKDDPVPHPLPRNQRSGPSFNQQPEKHSSDQPEPSVLKLPDASLLLNSPVSTNMSGYDHSSRVAAAMAENAASRKRESNVSASTNPRSKVPRGSLPHSRNIPEIAGGLLRPPQLSGRSNVVTEDISKLFVRRPTTDPSSN
ncbi:hypothetical protein LguiA_010744 [Lonicera macranthoides]